MVTLAASQRDRPDLRPGPVSQLLRQLPPARLDWTVRAEYNKSSEAGGWQERGRQAGGDFFLDFLIFGLLGL